MKKLQIYETPIPPEDARYIMDKANVTQVDLANELGYSDPSSVHKFINGLSLSQKFWDYFFTRFNVSKAS